MSTTHAPVTAQAVAEARNLSRNTICLQLRLRSLGTRAKVDSEEVISADTDKQAFHVAKDILQSAELDALRSHDNETRRWVRDVSLPSLLKGGVYMISIPAVPRVVSYLDAREREREGLVDAFVTAYAGADYRTGAPNGPLIQAAREKLKGQFRAEEYPSPAQARGAFQAEGGGRYVETRLFSFDTPEALRQLNPALWQHERDKAARDWESMYERVQTLLRAQMKELVDHMVDRLKPGEGGKKKVFRDSMVGNFRQFLDNFDVRNVTNDAELADLVKRAGDLLHGVEGEQIRSEEGLRNALAAGFEQLQGSLSTMVADAPGRKVDLDL